MPEPAHRLSFRKLFLHGFDGAKDPRCARLVGAGIPGNRILLVGARSCSSGVPKQASNKDWDFRACLRRCIHHDGVGPVDGFDLVNP